MIGTASRYNHDRVSAMGATPIDYRTQDFVQWTRELTGGGVDVVFDPIGGFRQLWRSNGALRRNGRLVRFGVAAAKQTGLKVIPLTLLMVGWTSWRRAKSTRLWPPAFRWPKPPTPTNCWNAASTQARWSW